MSRTELRLAISKILIKWGMGTRQIAIIEIARLLEKEGELRMAKSGDKAKKEKKKKKKIKKNI